MTIPGSTNAASRKNDATVAPATSTTTNPAAPLPPTMRSEAPTQNRFRLASIRPQAPSGLSWTELQAIEKRRRRILRHGEKPFVRILTLWEGTVWHALATDVLLYFVIAVYIITRVIALYFDSAHLVAAFSGDNIRVIGGFLTFFLVIYVNATNTRFNTLYDASMGCKGKVIEASLLAKACLPRERALRFVRYMNAAHIGGYIGVSETYSFDNFFTEINRTYRLLTDREVERMRQINMDTGGAAYLELLTWCLQEIETSHQAENAGDHPLATQLRSTVTALRDRLATLYNFDDQPVPFFYVHFTCLVSVYYLPLFAVDTALSAGVGDAANWVSEIVAALIVLLQLIFVIGLRVLAIKLANPYGSDNEDLSVIFYVHSTWLSSRRVLEAESPEPVDAAVEEALCREQVDIGKAWWTNQKMQA